MSLGYDIPSAKNISPSIAVSKPSDAVSTTDIYKSSLNTVTNLFQPLKLSTDTLKKEMSNVISGLQSAQSAVKGLTDIAAKGSLFLKTLDGATKLNPAEMLKGLMKIDSRVANAVKGFLNIPAIKSLSSITGTIMSLGGVVQKLKNVKIGSISSVFSLFNAVTGANVSPRLFDKGPLQAAMSMVFGEASKNKILGMWDQFKKVELYATIGIDVVKSLTKVIVKNSDVDLLKDISEDAYSYALLEADNRLLYNFAANYKLPKNATNEKINEIFTKFNEAANNLRPNWAFVTVNGIEQIDGYFITYGSKDFLKLISVYASKNVSTKYNEDTMLLNGDINDVNNPFTIDVQMNSSMKAASALHGLISNTFFAKITTKAHISNIFGLAV